MSVAAPDPSTRARTLLRAAVQWTVSIALLAWVWTRADWRELATQVSDVQWRPWAAGVALVVAAPILSSMRTRAIAQCVGFVVSLPQLLSLNLRAMRFVFLPGGEVLGGVARWHGMTQWKWSGTDAFGILVVERLLDLWLIAAIVAAIVPLWQIEDPVLRSIWLLALLALGGVTSLGLASLWLTSRPDRDAPGPRIVQTLARMIRATAATAAALLRSPRWLGRALATSIGFWCLALLGGVLIARGAVPDLDLVRYTIALCIVSLAAQLPISVAGAGLREATLAALLAAHGITPEKAVLIGTSALVPYALLSCVGIALAWRHDPEQQAIP